jgi:glycosyltransferase involved in cell wall biosynthesis
VVVYNNRGLPGTYVPMNMAFFRALSRLLTIHHEIYVTSFCFVPSFCLYLNRLLRGIPYVFNAVGLMSATYQDRAKRWPLSGVLERQLYPALATRILGGASWIVCNSQYLQRKFESEFPAYAHKTITIYNGIEFERFAAGKSLMIDGIPAEAPKLLAVMTWDYEKKASGAKLLIDAMGFITDKHPKAHLVIAAKVRHRRYAQMIEDYLVTKPWANSLTILYNQTNIPDLLASADLFVYATPVGSNDSLPRAMLEAHAAGLPIVATDTAGCSEIVENSVTGVLVPYNAEALAEYAVELLDDPTVRRRMGSLGQERVHELFSWHQMGEAYDTLFSQIAPGRE